LRRGSITACRDLSIYGFRDIKLSLAVDIARALPLNIDGSRAFLYHPCYLDTGGYSAEPPTLGLILGADHGAELPYVFGLLDRWKTKIPESDLKMQSVVMSYWTNFAKTLDPSGTGLPTWKSYDESSDAVMVVGESVGMRPHPRRAQLDFLKTHSAQSR